jgi:acetylornithine deacetylase/succinyl-diaminopimelate desuccinylase-like protein
MGGSIPLMGMLTNQFPESQFIITGVLGPDTNAHGPNEFLHIPMTKKLIGSVAFIIAETY